MAKIVKILSREILDSRGNPTVEVKVVLADGYFGNYIFSQGVSISKYEPKIVRDDDKNRFFGLGVQKAVDAIGSVFGPKLLGLEAKDQGKIDEILISIDEKKEKYGANAMLPISLAATVAQAASERLPLCQYLWKSFFADRKILIPTPIFSMIDGGLHGNMNLEFQEFLVTPASSYSYSEALKIGVEIYQSLKKSLLIRKDIQAVGDEGGFTPNLYTNAEALETINEVVAQLSYTPGHDVFYGIDISANQFSEGGHYLIKDRANPMSASEMIDFYKELLGRFRILVLEDPFSSDDWLGWQLITEAFGKQLIIAANEIIGGNFERLEKAIKEKGANTLVINPTQFCTLSEMVKVVKLASGASWRIIIATRSGDTTDTFISDLACACGADYVKFGAPARGERVAKYNRLLEIYSTLSQV